MKVLKIWIDNIELPKVDMTCKHTAGREFLQSEMFVHYTAYKSGNHTWRGEFKCSYTNEIDVQKLSQRISESLQEDTTITLRADDFRCVVNPNLPPTERPEWK